MKKLPAHHENKDTEASEPLQEFEAEAGASLSGQPARSRPAAQPRVVPPAGASADAETMDAFQMFEGEAPAKLPRTKAKPRPAGRPREPFDQSPPETNRQRPPQKE
jgi:hypothetical protein